MNVLLGLVTAGIVTGAVFFAPVEISVAGVGFASLVIGLGVSWVWGQIGGAKWAAGIKQRWAQEIRQAGQGTTSSADELPGDWPDTPNGLAP